MASQFRGGGGGSGGRYNQFSRGGGNAGGGGRGGRGRGGGQYGGRGGGGNRGGSDNRGGFSRGGGGGPRGGGFSRGGHGGDKEHAKKENILDLGQYMNREIYIKFNGGREVSGVLKGFDALLNMVLDEAQEKMQNSDGEEKSRSLGLAVIRGTHITTLYPVDGSESIANPYLAAEAANGGGDADDDDDDDDDDDEEDGKPKADSKITPAYQYTPKADEQSD